MPQGPTYCTYGVRVPASGVGYVQRTVATQVTAPDYEALQLIYMARRLYTADRRPEERLSADAKSDLDRRFAEGAKRLLTLTLTPNLTLTLRRG